MGGGKVIKNYSLKERAELYNTAFPQYSKYAWLQASDYWLWGIWSIGNNYKGRGYLFLEHIAVLSIGRSRPFTKRRWWADGN